jgi:hypothetical protein
MWKAAHSEILPRYTDFLIDKKRVESRPTSASRGETRHKLTAKHRSRSGHKRVKQHTSGLLRNRGKLFGQDFTQLTKLKPRAVKAEKERLYEDNLALKQQNNQLTEENIRLKTKLSLLDRELNKHEETINELKSSRSPSLKKIQALVSLKQGMRELKVALEERDKEIEGLKRHIKSTKLTELQTEMQAYVDECTRLRRHYDELVELSEQQHLTAGRRQEITEQLEMERLENQELLKSIEVLKEDRDNWEQIARNLEMKRTVKKRSPTTGIKRLRKTLEEMQDRHKTQVMGYENEVKALKAECTRLSRLMKEAGAKGQKTDQKPSAALPVERPKTSHRADLTAPPARDNRLSIPSSPQIMTFTDVGPQSYVKESGLTSISEEEAILKQSPESLREAEELEISETEMKTLLTHLRFRVQLHRLSRSDLIHYLKESLPEDNFADLFSIEPFAIEDPQTRLKLLAYLCPKSMQGGSRRDIEMADERFEELTTSLLKHLGDWMGLSADDEARYDQKITAIMQHSQFSILEACKLLDEDLSGLVTFKQFCEVLDNLDIEFSDDELRYLRLLFYSHDCQLDQVPYQHFIKAYSGVDRLDESLDDEARTELVKAILQILARELTTHKLTVREVFTTSSGVIDGNSVIKALKTLQIPELDHNELFVFLEALAAENQEDLCIDCSYLEEILTHYGVPLSSKVDSSRQSSSRASVPQFSTKTYESSILKSERSDFIQPNFGSNSGCSELQENISMLESPGLSKGAISSYDYSEDSKKRSSQHLTDQSPFFSPECKLWLNSSHKSLGKSDRGRHEGIIRVEGVDYRESKGSSARHSEDFGSGVKS